MADYYPKLSAEYYTGAGCDPGSAKDVLTQMALNAKGQAAELDARYEHPLPDVDTRMSKKAVQGNAPAPRGIPSTQSS